MLFQKDYQNTIVKVVDKLEPCGILQLIGLIHLLSTTAETD